MISQRVCQQINQNSMFHCRFGLTTKKDARKSETASTSKIDDDDFAKEKTSSGNVYSTLYLPAADLQIQSFGNITLFSVQGLLFGFTEVFLTNFHSSFS